MKNTKELDSIALDQPLDRLVDPLAEIPAFIWETALTPAGTSSHFTYLSESAERILGYSREELLKPQTWQDMVYPEDRQLFLTQIQHLYVSTGRSTIQHRVVTPDGRIVPLEATLTLIRDPSGVPIRLRGITLDISERYRSIERLKLLVGTGKIFAEEEDFRTAIDRAIQRLVPQMADLCQVFLLNDAQEFERVAAAASSPKLAALWKKSHDRFPPRKDTRRVVYDVIETKESALFAEISDDFQITHSRSPEHLELMRQLDIRSAIVTPLFLGDEMFGTITVSRRGMGIRYTEEDVLFLEEFARAASYAFQKARLTRSIESELAGRRVADERLELMSAVGQHVSSSLDLQELLREAARAIVPRFADWITVDLADSTGKVSRIFIHHGDTTLQAKAEEYSSRFGLEITRGLVNVMRSGTPIFIPQTQPADLEKFGLSAARWHALQQLGASSLIMVPLCSRRRTLGVLGLDYGHSNRHYTIDDIELASEIASRIATGIDNALLFAEAHAEIERRIQLQKKLEKAKEDAEIANRAKDQFIATLSHELRTPLTPVLATVDLLEDDVTIPDALRPFLGLIRRNIEIESRLIDDLLDMTRIAKGKLRMTANDVDLHALLPEVIEICRSDIERAHIKVATHFGLLNSFVRGDKDRLSQVFWNVIHNATKFTPEGGLISIETRTESGNNGSHSLIVIRDTGRGIGRNELSRIFEPFEQEREGGGQTGLGLGLSISKSIVEMHGGTIEARSDGHGKGAAFIIRLEPLEVKQVLSQVPARPLASHNGSHILFVDDHADTNAALKVLLERRGYRVTTAGSVMTGLELARKQEFDLLVSDIGLPDGNGTDLLRLIREEESGARKRPLRAIAVSGYGTDADVARSREAGFIFHLKKPIAFPDLERAISEALSDD